MKAALKILGIIFALVLLAGIMAYLAGFFDEKIPIDFSCRVVPAAVSGREFTVKVAKEPLFEQAAGTLRAKVETRIYIPLKAVTHVGQLDFVIVATEQGAVRRYVRLGESGPDDRIEVISGLTAGETNKIGIPKFDILDHCPLQWPAAGLTC